jgi:hypothetical protein
MVGISQASKSSRSRGSSHHPPCARDFIVSAAWILAMSVAQRCAPLARFVAKAKVPSRSSSQQRQSLPSGLAPGIALAAWYAAVILPEAQTVLHRQTHRKDVSRRSVRRVVPFVAALCYLGSLPTAVALRWFNRRKAAVLALSAVFVNPPTLLIVSVIVSEIGALTLRSVRRLVSSPFEKLLNR